MRWSEACRLPSRFDRVARWGVDHFHFGEDPGYPWYGMVLLLVWAMFWGVFMFVEAIVRWVGRAVRSN